MGARHEPANLAEVHCAEIQPHELARIRVTLRPNVHDPQGSAISHALEGLGLNGVGGVRQGKYFEIRLENTTTDEAVQRLCQKLLCNTVVETYDFELEDA
jgi:phosphoribosylformylglycinamidine synthase PurS subunit